MDSKASEVVADVSASALSTHMEDLKWLGWGMGRGL